MDADPPVYGVNFACRFTTHPNVSEVYRRKVERLTEALNKQDDRAEAAEAIRGLVEKITLAPGTKRGEIDATLHGELSTILGWIAAQSIGKAVKRDTPAACAAGVSVSLVAGTSNHLYLLFSGDLAGILTLSVQTKSPAGVAGQSQVKMVAGAGFDHNLRTQKGRPVGAADVREFASQVSLVAGTGFEPVTFRL